MSTRSRSALMSLALALVAVAPAKAQVIDWDFNSNDGFWTTQTAAGSEAWSWSAGSWLVGNTTDPSLAYLISPEVTAGFVLGAVVISHRYNFEPGSSGECFDGGTVSYRVNGGAWNPLSFVPGYNGTVSGSFSSPIAGRQAWCGKSAGYDANIFLPAIAGGFVNPGDTYQLRLEAGWDSSIERPAPNWEVTRVMAFGFQGEVPDPTVVPEPSTVALLATGLVGMGAAAIRRRRRSS